MEQFTLQLDAAKTKGPVSDTLFGLFLEDINDSCDGGLNANLVRNWSFDDVTLKKFKGNEISMTMGRVGRMETQPDFLRHWHCTGGGLESLDDAPAAPGSRYARVTSRGVCTLENPGYCGHEKTSCGMAITAGKTYRFSAWLRSAGFQGQMLVSVRDAEGQSLTGEAPAVLTDSWAQAALTLPGMRTGMGKLVLTFAGEGAAELDGVCLMDADCWGAGEPKWSQGKLRRDLVECLAALKPRFLRFPGGCITEGLDPGNEYHWKDSVGPLLSRRQDYNLWAMEEPDFSYVQSRQVGFYEFFLLCEDLGMEPLPVVWAGMNCQMRRRPAIPADGPEFEQQVVQNALDLIEYANGDPAESPWARLRAEAGHPAPFRMHFLGIGNENFGPDYLARFRKVKAAVDSRYPGITCILGAGAMPDGKDFDYLWQEARRDLPDVYIDEHFYKKPRWVIAQQRRYDAHPRSGPKVFLGEYAAYDVMAGMLKKSFVPNRFDTALAEAAFLTGVERNADVVAMSCYAPLLALAGGEQWKHNLIFFNGHAVMHTANYYVQQLFMATVEQRIVPVEDRLPAGIFASATRSAGRLCLKLVNTGARPYGLRLDVRGFDARRADVTTLACADLHAHNTLTFTGEPQETVVPQTRTCLLQADTELQLAPHSLTVLQFEQRP